MIALRLVLLMTACELLAGRIALGQNMADAPAEGDAAVATIEWRPWGRAAFEEAEERGRPVFLWLTAPWTWDHFLLESRLFASTELLATLRDSAVPVRADASVHDELRSLYRIESGLLPSFHFLDSRGERLASFPPLEEEELIYFLGSYEDVASADRLPERSPPVVLEVHEEKLANRLARFLLDLSERDALPIVTAHGDPDVSALLFLNEIGRESLPRRTRSALQREVGRVLNGPLIDPDEGGFHRAFATADGNEVHYEKTLRLNAEWGELLATMFGANPDPILGRDALKTVAFLNGRLLTRGTTLYVGSTSADVFDHSRTELVLEGREYYALRGVARTRFEGPAASPEIPVGANWRFHEALEEYFRTYADVRMRRAVKRGAPLLIDEGFALDGLALAEFGEAARGNLGAQAAAGSGLLAYHALTGRSAPLETAEKLATGILRAFHRDEDARLASLPRDADAPDAVRGASPNAAYNGAAARFLLDLTAVTGQPAYAAAASEILREWSRHVPEDGRGVGELGRAALRLDDGAARFFLVADPESDEGRRLRDLAYRIPDPTVTMRWVAPGDERTARRLGLALVDEPSIYVGGRDGVSPAVRQLVTLRAAYRRARESASP